MFSFIGKKIWVAGHNGMVGRSVVKQLQNIDAKILSASRSELDLTKQEDVSKWFALNKPDVVIICAAKVGGIAANNDFPAEFIYENLMIQSNIVKSSFENNVEKLILLGSSCIYPKYATQPISEDFLLTGELESTNEWYAVAKIAGIKLCQAYRNQYGCDYISVMPTNLYGPHDNFDLKSSHVVPALIRKTFEAKLKHKETVEVWGSGLPKREFLHVDDCAKGILFLLENYSEGSHINLGTGIDITIKELSKLIAEIIGFKGQLIFDKSKPDGTPRKLLDIEKISKMGWKPQISLKDGLRETIEFYEKEYLKGL
ncbi:GDP-L-fucose synthase [SAR86 cluster bacterium]|nr:GDP-L-fucose synthase [SAR86 cluster bacterium]